MSLLCIAGAGVTVRIAATVFTLAWTHTIEKVPWEEDWRIEGHRLMLTQSRIKGSGAGMEPPPDARLEDGFYRWAPADPYRTEVILRRAPVEIAGDWRLCVDGACRRLGEIVPVEADPVRLSVCPDDATDGLRSP
ncbi:DUF1850 domain-containing protein [Methylobrevis pamukkalensis]|uniref:DUF1850 domain-containing protein n=1 Tax=Methylobrevis pamukkalensis TaxID=1439726 RepID=A0A1E3GZ95_9HYPH|nr:DUF1850 domain-containing protein [Methylobrevis pamukkalensis]ODN68631.1 hypothetical protein A6302_04067 [Methylobrevis pamukkalensis]